MGAGHSHATELQPATPGLRRALALAVGLFALLTLAATVRLWPSGYVPPDTQSDLASTMKVNATVTKVTSGSCGPGSGQTCDAVSVVIDSGPDAGHTEDLPSMQPTSAATTLHLDDKVVLDRTVIAATNQVAYSYSSAQRSQPLWALALIFAALVIVVARWRGIAAIAGLAITWAVLVAFLVPAILNGENPVAVALTSAALIIFVVLYLAHGVNARTTIALLGTLASLVFAGGLAVVFVAATHLTGLASEEASYIKALNGDIDVTGLLLAGIIIGVLGVLTDITVTQSDIVWEIHAAEPSRPVRILFAAGMRTGRHHIASTVYTLVLAYAGASLPLLLLFAVANQSFGDVVTGEIVAEEVVRALLGSIGLVASVPFTTFLAAFVVTRSRHQTTSIAADHDHDHDHSPSLSGAGPDTQPSSR